MRPKRSKEGNMHKLFATLLLLSFPMFAQGQDPLEIGATAPAPSVLTDAGETLDLSAAYAKGPVLVYFYPKSDTPGCTKQACNLRDNFDAVQAAGITVLGVSRDEVEKQAAFKDKYSLPFTLIADKDGTLGEAFGVGKAALFGVHRRQSFLVLDGKVVWRDLKASPGSQSEDVLAALNAVQKS